MILSVLMSVYSKERPSYLRCALGSLAAQTLKADEVVLVEDGPISGDLVEVISDFKRSLNIKSVRLPVNLGLAAALNEGLKHCSGELVARMDTDDFSLPHRFSIQMEFMRSHPDVAVCSSIIEERSEDMSTVIGLRLLPEGHGEIIEFAKKRNPISHPAVIYRKDAILSVGGYPNIYPEDYPLWCLLLVKGFRFANIQEVTLLMRTGEGFIARRGYKFFRGVLKAIWFQKRIGFISWPEFFMKVLYRAVAHLSPVRLRRYWYDYARKNGDR